MPYGLKIKTTAKHKHLIEQQS